MPTPKLIKSETLGARTDWVLPAGRDTVQLSLLSTHLMKGYLEASCYQNLCLATQHRLKLTGNAAFQRPAPTPTTSEST